MTEDAPLTEEVFRKLIQDATRTGAVQGLREAASMLLDVADKLEARYREHG